MTCPNVFCNSHLFPVSCGAGSAVPREGFDLSIIILASLLVFRVGGHYLVFLALSIKVVLQGYLFSDHF